MTIYRRAARFTGIVIVALLAFPFLAAFTMWLGEQFNVGFAAILPLFAVYIWLGLKALSFLCPNCSSPIFMRGMFAMLWPVGPGEVHPFG